MMDFQTILYEVKEGIATITLNRPDNMNAIDMLVRDELLKAVKLAEIDDKVRVLVLTGAGKAFSAGGDLKKVQEMEVLAGRDRVLTLNKVIIALTYLEKPVISAVNGVAAGAGCNLALTADICIASDNAKFGQAFSNIALVPDAGGSFLLPRLVGLVKAKELIFFGEVISAQKAEQIGMINKVVPESRFMEEVESYAKRLCERPTRAIGLSKKLINQGLSMSLETILELEATYQGLIRQSEEHKEGIQAFMEKRNPHFK